MYVREAGGEQGSPPGLVSEWRTTGSWGGEFEGHKSGHTCLSTEKHLKGMVEWESRRWAASVPESLCAAVDSCLEQDPKVPALGP